MQLTKDEIDALAEQHRVPGHATMIDHQAFAAAVIAAHERKVLEDVEPFVFEEYPYNSHAMGCGLEDRDITDRYEAMAYGWERAMERAAEAIPDDLYPAATVAALKSRADALQARVDALEKDAARYRWLRDGELTADYPYPVMRMGGSRVDDQTIWADELDAAIDDAISAAQHPQQEQSK